MITEINNPNEYILTHNKHYAKLTRLEDENIYGIPVGEIGDYFGTFPLEGILISMTNNDVAILSWYFASGSIHINTLGSTGGELGKRLVTYLIDVLFPLATIEVMTGESPTLCKYYQQLGFSVIPQNLRNIDEDGYISMILER